MGNVSFRKSILIIYLSEERTVHTKFRHSAKEVGNKNVYTVVSMPNGLGEGGCSLLADRVNKVDNLQGSKSPRKCVSSLKLVKVFVCIVHTDSFEGLPH